MVIRAVLFDLGGVLAYDVWEHVFLDAGYGIADRLGIAPMMMQQVGRAMWQEFIYCSGDWKSLEQTYWQNFIAQLQPWLMPEMKDPDYWIDISQNFIRTVANMKPLLTELCNYGIKLGICCTNTAFWFHRQFYDLGLNFLIPNRYVVTSFEMGLSLEDQRCLIFQEAMYKLNERPTTCMFVSDETEEVKRALECGMMSVIFPHESYSGADYLRKWFMHLDILDCHFF